MAVRLLDDETGSRRWVGPKHLETEHTHGAICRNPRVIGTAERVRRRRAGEFRDGSEKYITPQ